MKTIVLTGGGTAGHVIPNIALLPDLKKHFDSIHYIGSKDGIEKGITENYPEITYHEIDCAKLKRSFSFSNLIMPFKVLQGISQSKRILKEVKPDIIFSKGGFVSVPVVLASGKIPVVSHESDLTVGLANKLTAGRARAIATSFLETAAGKENYVHTGTPLRRELLSGNAAAATAQYNIGGVKPVLLVLGGSLGSKALNESVRGALPELIKNFDVLHITGKGNVDHSININGYVQIAFCLQLQDIFALADVVITRGGSNAINELLALKKPMLIVPLPKTASRGDQIDNANNFASRGIAKVLLQEALNPKSLTENILTVYNERDRLKGEMDAQQNTVGNDKIIELILANLAAPAVDKN